MIDTVAHAAATGDRPQPFAELGLTGDEYQRIRRLLGRRPSDCELAIYSVMWSEHCSYKSSRLHLRQLADKAPPSAALLAGIGQNAGVVDIGQGYAVTFKIESHNHPSYVEPFQGAATGVGGIVRDILAMGARPVAVMDALRFGPAGAPDTARVLPGVVGGISFYGNCLGLPNIGGELVFDPCYAGNPLVNALCVGVMRHGDLQLAAARGEGNKVILFGAGTGPDGIGGASVLASASFGGGESAKRPSVQVGDPFMEKLLVECCLELGAAGLVAGIQDLGAAGISCATAELAAGGGSGMRIALDAVPLRDPTLGPAEILMSESQERMMAIAAPGDVDRFLAICARWEVPATVIGEVTGTGRLELTWHGEQVVDIAPETAADQGPVYDRPAARPAGQDALAADDPATLPRPRTGEELRAALLSLLGSPSLADKTWVTQQYDRHVRGDTVLAMPEDAGVIRVDERDRPRAGARHRRQRAVLPARPVRGHAARAGRGVPERGGHRRPPGRRHQLPELRVAGGPGGHVAVRRGGAGPRRRLRPARHPGDRRQRELLQPDRGGGHPPDPGGGGARRAGRRAAPGADRVLPPGRAGGAARHDPRRVRRVGVGAGGARSPRRPPAHRRFGCRTGCRVAARRRGAGRPAGRGP